MKLKLAILLGMSAALTACAAEAELGVTTNEPDQVALQQAIEKAVYGLVIEGVELKLLDFANKPKASALLQRYQRERDGVIPAKALMAAVQRANGATPEKIRPRAVMQHPVDDGSSGSRRATQ